MTLIEELIAFLRARLDEDEQWALECGGAPWSAPIPGMVHVDAKAIADNKLALGKLGYVATVLHEEDRRHIARHDPARILREVESKRRIIDQHIGYYGTGDDEFLPVQVLRLLALPYMDHPDYREAWLP